MSFIRPRTMGAFLFAILCGILVPAAPAAAQLYRVQVLGEGECHSFAPASSVPVDYRNNCSKDGVYQGSVHGRAGRGFLIADTTLSWILDSSYGTCEVSSFVANGLPGDNTSDLVFTGPPDATSVPMSFSMHADFVTNGDPNDIGNPLGSFFAWIHGASIYAPFSESTEITYTSNTSVVPLNTPITYEFSAYARVKARPGTTRVSTIGVSFAGSRSRVFDLPDGYTANSPSLNIVNNAWTPPCPADLNGDGSVDFFDVSLFLNLYNAQDPLADMAPPSGVWNFFDVSAYITAYNAGCP